MQQETLKQFTLEKKPGSLIVITGEIPYEELIRHRESAIATVGKDIEIDGFRKGHIPEKMLIARVGEMAIMSEMAEKTLHEYYPAIVTTHTLDVIGYPHISLTKLAPENPLGFTITVAIVPEVTLPDYTAIVKGLNAKKESKEVTDEDVEKQIADILRQKTAYERLQAKAKAKADAGEAGIEEEKDAKEFDSNALPLPELTDEYVKTLGKPGQFESVTQFREQIREHLAIEKAQEVDSNHRAHITDAIIEKTTMDLPQVLVDAEIDQMLAQMQTDLERAQLKIDDYLAHIKKTKEDLIQEWTPSAEKRAKLQLVLNEIAKKEGIVADPSLVDHEVSHLLEQYKDADEKRVRVYVASVLVNEAVLRKLEETV